MAPSTDAQPTTQWSWRLSDAIRAYGTPQLWGAVALLLTSLVPGLFWFIVLIPLLATGLTLVIVFFWVGLPFVMATAFIWRAAARIERQRIARFMGVTVPPPYRALPVKGRFARARLRASDPAVWRDLWYVLLLFPLGLIEFILVVVVFVYLPAIIFLPTYFWAWSGFLISTPQGALFVALLALVAFLYAPLALRAVAGRHVALALALLGPPQTAQLAARVEELSVSRSRLLELVEAERQRIERDLHDGAQQRLVALAMDLGMAREKMTSDPAAAEVLVTSAHEEAKRALRELRDLVRGIYPAVLTDRGLDAALSALAGRSPLPVTLDVALDGRLPQVVESTAYFVVAEALTNVAKHSHASAAHVAVRRADGRLIVAVADDGVGGADTAVGAGLAGLADRVGALDGHFVVESPPGGPTRIQMEVPCGS